eukprot:PITA_32921
MQKLYNYEAEQERESLEDNSDEENNDENENPNPKSEEDMPRISLAAITGIAQPQTLKLKGHIKKQNIIVLINSGNGIGKCHKVKLQLSKYEMESSFYTVPQGGVDVVLGMQWLQTLGTYSANHQKKFIKFKLDGRKYKLFGFQAPPTQVISTWQMKKLIRKGTPAFVTQCQQLELLSIEGTHQPSEISSLIQKYEKVFQDLPMKLPPEKQIEHIIEVKPNSTPVNVKPYCYAHHPKTEIE